MKQATIRAILSISMTKEWHLHQVDVNNAFRNGMLNEEVYMSQPEGFLSSNPCLVCKLHRSLYGLKQAPRAWFHTLSVALLKLGFHASKCDPSLFIKHMHCY